MVHKFKVEKELTLEDLVLSPGDVVDGVQVDNDLIKIFVRNGWWVVGSSNLSQIATKKEV